MARIQVVGTSCVYINGESASMDSVIRNATSMLHSHRVGKSKSSLATVIKDELVHLC